MLPIAVSQRAPARAQPPRRSLYDEPEPDPNYVYVEEETSWLLPYMSRVRQATWYGLELGRRFAAPLHMRYKSAEQQWEAALETMPRQDRLFPGIIQVRGRNGGRGAERAASPA